MSSRQWSAIHREACVQAHCMTWMFAYFDMSWVVQGGGRSLVPCSGRDAVVVRRGQGHMRALLEQNLLHEQHVRQGFDQADNRTGISFCILAMI